MSIEINDTPQAVSATLRASREEESKRKAVARRKLEALLERKRLRVQLTDVWDELAGTENGRRYGTDITGNKETA